MCGIAGLVSRSERHSVLISVLAGMNQRLCHRGPDDEGYLLFNLAGRAYRVLIGDDSKVPADLTAQGVCHIRDAVMQSADVAFAHRRLSILDCSPAGHQPMSSPDGRFHLVYNGEVYNFVELRKELSAGGWSFRSGSDTEVVLAALAMWGPEALPRFIGMFALAWLDLQTRRMLFARDTFGIKPLHYCQTEQLFAFASEPRALLEVPGVSRILDPETAYTYLRYNITDHSERTFFSDIRQLAPAHYLEIDLDKRRVGEPTRYWNAESSAGDGIPYAEATEQLRARFIDSVRLHLRSDVPVAVMLSGGIDSSSVTMAARRVLGDDADLGAFSYIASEARANEQRWIRLVAEAARLQLHEIHPSTEHLIRDLEAVIESQQAPFGSLSIFAQYSVFRAVGASGTKVILSGQGADEVLGGYSPFAAARLASMVRQGRLLAASRFYLRGSREWPGRKQMTMGLAQHLLPAFLQSPLRRISGHGAAPDWLHATWFRERDVQLRSPRDLRRESNEPLKTALRDSLTRTNLPELLRYEDRNSMAHSVESRVPFLTTPLVSFLLSLPESYIINDHCRSKAALRDAMRSVVPDPILDRRDKVAFSAPIRQWFDQLRPWFDRSLNDDALQRLPMLNTDVVKQHWQRVANGRIRPDTMLWRWVNLSRWMDRFEVIAD